MIAYPSAWQIGREAAEIFCIFSYNLEFAADFFKLIIMDFRLTGREAANIFQFTVIWSKKQSILDWISIYRVLTILHDFNLPPKRFQFTVQP